VDAQDPPSHGATGPHAPPRLVERPEDLHALCGRLAHVPRLALDTESNSLHAYRERTCLVQLASDDESTIVDALALPDLSALGAVVARPDLELVLHGGDYDVAVLSRDHAFTFPRVFDTMVAATLLAEPRVGLADLALAHLGVVLDKRLQKADWSRRPLGPRELEYLHGDVRWLFALRDLLGARLEAADLVEEAAIEFRRLAARRPRPRPPESERWREQDGAETLDDAGRAALAGLWAWREGEAARRDVPPFKVLAPQALVAVARALASVGPGASSLALLPPRDRTRHGDALSEVLRTAWADARAGRAPPPDPPRPRPTDEERAAAKRRRAREDALRAWRREASAARSVPPVVVLPNPAIEWLVGAETPDLAALAAHPDVGPKRAERYGTSILAALEGAAR
jgi:ribonuclease D